MKFRENFMNKKIILILLSVLTLSSCQGHKQQWGTVAGGLAGAAIGSQFGGGDGQLVGIAAGALLGGMIGNQIGESLDEKDRNYSMRTSQYALESAPSGRTQVWRNPDSGHSGEFTPTRTFQSGDSYCREYVQKVFVGGKAAEAHGTACRMPDGTWKIRS
jgi:surface antigen